MDYEKKYKEALNWMRSIYPTLTGSDKEDAEHYFPELHVSEDERIRNEIIAFMEQSIHRGGGTPIPQEQENKWIAWLEKQKEEEPAEWSEEDERILKGIIGKIDHDQTYGVSKVEMLSFLRFLKPQPKQEWSKEETKDLVHILKVLDDCYAYGKHDLSKTDHDNLTSTIKFLRPSWKPSEEQMKALYKAAEYFQENHFVCTPLESLYEQLKKLK